MTVVAVVDYGIGNVFSVCNAVKAAGGTPLLTCHADELSRADRVILPGVGAFAVAMHALKERGLTNVLQDLFAAKTPVLGICIGMQVMMESSEEFGHHAGCGFIEGVVERIDKRSSQIGLRVPHVSWAKIHFTGNVQGWLRNVTYDKTAAYYFVHSYHCQPTDSRNQAATAMYQDVRLTSIVQKDSVVGVQFHPERSGHAGQRFLKAFISETV